MVTCHGYRRTSTISPLVSHFLLLLGWVVVGASLLAEEEGPQNLGGEKLNLPMNFGLQIRAGQAPLLLPRLGCVPGAGCVLPACPLPFWSSLFKKAVGSVTLWTKMAQALWC